MARRIGILAFAVLVSYSIFPNQLHAEEIVTTPVPVATDIPQPGPHPELANQNPQPAPVPTPQTTIPPSEQVGSWAVVDKNGNVVNAIACQEKVCGANGQWHGQIEKGGVPGCEDGCILVLQSAPNPVTGQSNGGWATGGNTKVTYKDGEFTVESKNIAPGSAGANAGQTITSITTIKDGIATNADGQVRDIVSGKILDPGHPPLPISVLPEAPDLYTPIEQVFADAISAGTIEVKKTKSGYILDTNWDVSKTAQTVKVTATKKGSKTKLLTLNLDENGDLVLPSKVSLKGYQLSVKKDGKTLGKLTINK